MANLGGLGVPRGSSLGVGADYHLEGELAKSALSAGVALCSWGTAFSSPSPCFGSSAMHYGQERGEVPVIRGFRG